MKRNLIIQCKYQQEEEKVQGKYLEILEKKGKKGYDLEPSAGQPWRNNVQIYNAENGSFYPYNLYECAT